MSTRDGGEPWFVVRMSAFKPGRARGVVPVTRAGWMTLVQFFIGEAVCLALGVAIILLRPEIMLVGIAVIVAGFGVSFYFLITRIRTHTDYAMTEDEYWARQAQVK